MRFQDKVVVVTGASSGMGRTIAADFAREGATVIAVARREERLLELQADCANEAGRIIPFVGDVSLDEVNTAMINLAVQDYGRLDVLVNNAGIMDEFLPIAEIDNERMDRILNLNLKGPIYAMRRAVQVMLEQEEGGNIVNIASIGGTNGCRAGAVYTASKHALVGLTRNTAYMYANDKIRCNVICPGGVETEVAINCSSPSGHGISRVMSGLDKSIRIGQSSEISPMVLFLASDDASFINGADIKIDGGVSCN